EIFLAHSAPRRAANTLAFVHAQASRGDFRVSFAQKRIVTAGFQDCQAGWIERQVSVREKKGRCVPNEPSRAPWFYESKLRRKAIRIARGRERLPRQNRRSSVMSVSQLILRTKTSHHYIWPKLSMHPNQLDNIF